MTDIGSQNNLALGITARCNYNCVFCILGDTRTSFADMDAAVVRRLLRDRKKEFSFVSFTGGEPTLRTELPRLAAYAKDLGYRVQISSNGGMFGYRDYCRQFGRDTVDTYFISLSAFTAKSYEKATRTRGSFRHALAGIRNLLSLGRRVVTNTVIHKGNFRALPALARGLAGLGHGHCRFTFPMYAASSPHANASCHVRKADIPDVLGSLRSAVDILVGRGVAVKIAMLPFCQLRGYEDHIEAYGDDEALYLTTGEGSRRTNMCAQVRFRKNVVCRGCRFNGICRGVESTSPFVPKR